ncbi:hypothetical protein SK128_002434 [Halocaridina rubra]|uniref:Uncharacterized protein n=1 Tax=Halocaridina rubra TaxID=373956 RepID=A0AAN8XE22_HALRR
MNFRNLILIIFWMLLMTALSSSLVCLGCDDCNNASWFVVPCSRYSNVCVDSEVNGVVRKRCGNKISCQDAGSEGLSIWGHIRRLLSVQEDEEDKIDKLSQEPVPNVLMCCAKDYCNNMEYPHIIPISSSPGRGWFVVWVSMAALIVVHRINYLHL